MTRLRRIFLLGLVFLALGLTPAQAAPPEVVVLKVDGAINPVLADYIDRGISLAEARGAVAVVIEMDTPGGLDTAMRDIIQRINGATVPIVVFVSPAGARAASAGTFITMAAHIAAMAPNTAIGAAHPVAGGGKEISGTMEEKVVNDAVAYIRGIAELRGRNADWAEQAVRQSVSINQRQALEQNVIDLVTPDLPSLLADIDGRQVQLLGATTTLHTQGVALRRVDMSLVESFLFTITDPTIAYILLTLAMTGLFFELANPGAILPGVVGGIFLLLALYSLGTLPVNWAGVLLIGLAFILFVADAFLASHGALTVGGLSSLVIGSLILVSTTNPLFRIDPWVIAVVAITVTGFFAFVVGAIVRAHHRRPITGAQGIIGKRATARTPLTPMGTIFVEGELWTAISQSGQIETGEEVTVIEVDGMRVKVTRASLEGP